MESFQDMVNNDALKSDLIYLLDHKEDWKTLVSVYDDMDSTLQYPHILNEICKKQNLDEKNLLRNTQPFRYYLSLLVIENISEENFKNSICTLNHNNQDEFVKFMIETYHNLKSKLLKLKMTQIALEHHINYFLDDVKIKLCNTVIDDSTVPFVLLNVDDSTYQCTIKDIKILITKLSNIIEKCD